jgi:uncharacterized Zn-binding protein involved in type VI secretion
VVRPRKEQKFQNGNRSNPKNTPGLTPSVIPGQNSSKDEEMSGHPAARVTDLGSGHGCHFPPSPALSGSTDIIINNLAAFRQGDAYLPHPCPVCPQPPHPRNLSRGSATVYFNGRQAGRVTDPINCGGSHMLGSSNVEIGGMSPPGLTRAPFCEACEDAASRAK